MKSPGNVFGSHQKDDNSAIAKDEDLSHQLKFFIDKINNSIPKENALLIFERIKNKLPPGILWSYLREKYPEVLCDQIKNYLFPDY